MQYWTWYSLIWVQSHLRWHATGGSRVVFLIHSYELTFYGMTFSTVRAQLKMNFKPMHFGHVLELFVINLSSMRFLNSKELFSQQCD